MSIATCLCIRDHCVEDQTFCHKLSCSQIRTYYIILLFRMFQSFLAHSDRQSREDHRNQMSSVEFRHCTHAHIHFEVLYFRDV